MALRFYVPASVRSNHRAESNLGAFRVPLVAAVYERETSSIVFHSSLVIKTLFGSST